MYLRYFQRGEQVTAEKLNALVDAIRQSAVQSGPGYNVQQTSSGTVLSITPQSVGGGGGGGAAPLCLWSVTDVSERDGDGKLILKIRVNVSPVEPGGRYPTGTSEETPYKIITLGELVASWQCVYLRIVVDQKNNILDGDEGINVNYVGNTWPESNSVIQNTYLAGITISDDGDGGTYISDITNFCPVVKVQPAPTCAFKIEDYSLGASVNPQISIRSTTIERHYPTGMDDTDTYVLTIPNTQEWWAVYAALVTDSVGNILFGPNDVTLTLSDTYLDSTPTLTYFLLGEVNTGYNADSQRVIDYIYNACQVPFITGAVSNGTIVPRGTVASCPFGATKEVITNTQYVSIAKNTVNTPSARWPLGMGPDSSPYYIAITQTTYIYIKILYVENDVIVDPNDYAVTIAAFSELKENTVNEEYVLVSVVTFESGEITEITNSCMSVTANPCNLKWD